MPPVDFRSKGPVMVLDAPPWRASRAGESDAITVFPVDFDGHASAG
jgi:hypothetical protein